MAARRSGAQQKKWTLNGAARFARDARIATAAHLREAPIAREWHAAKLMRAHAVHLENFGHLDAATALLFGGLGYEPPYPAGWEQAADLMLADEAENLAAADLYVLTPQMCDVVIAAALSLSVKDLELLDPEDLPGPVGLIVLPYPLMVRTVGGDLADDRAYAWSVPATFTIPAHPEPERRAAVHLAVFHDAYGPVRPETYVQFLALARERGTPVPPLLLDAQRNVPFHSHGDAETALAQLRRATAQVDGQARAAATALGLDEEHLEPERADGQYVSGDPIDDVDDLFALKFCYAFWRLCEQRLTEIAEAPAGHAAALAAERAGVGAEVRVVLLRRAEQASGAEPAGAREWSHRWIVRMHKVRQWYPSEGRHKVIYRGPYVKGPADKPLLGGETVRALVR